MAEPHPPPATHPQLVCVAEKTLPSKCKPRTLTYCPSMDLVALATEDEQVHVFRLNGQRVFGGVYGAVAGGGSGSGHGNGSGSGSVVVRGLRWKGNGHLLAVGCSDNSIRILGAYSGKTIHNLPCGSSLSPPSPSSPTSGPQTCLSCLGWGTNFTDGKAVMKSLQESAGTLSVDDLLSPNMPLSKLAQLKADLPRELALLDIMRSLPKLSTLPSTGDEDDVFSSRTSIDAIFQGPNKTSNDSVDVLLAGFDDGTVHLRIFDCFEIGSLYVGSSFGQSNITKALLHASHPLSSTHSLLFSTTDSVESNMRLLTLDLKFITRSGRYLSLLASKITQLQNLLRYIKQVQHQIHLEWKNAQDLPSRFIRNVTEDLEERCSCDFVTAAYHLLVTGDCFEPLKEFLVDQLGDRGHKRWDKAVTSGYETLRRLTHECLLPALERCGVLLSRLIGLSKFHKLSPVLGLETKDLNECLNTVDCLNLLAHKVLIHSGRELREFGSFSKWLRYEVDLQTADPLSATAEELTEKGDTLDHGQTLSYIQGALTQSALHDFLQPTPSIEPSEPSEPDRWKSVGQDSSFYDTYKRLLRQQEQPKTQHKTELPLLVDLTSRLNVQCDKVFRQIAETQRRGILHRSPFALCADCDADVADMAMNFGGDSEGETLGSVYIASKSKKSPWAFYLYRAVLDSVNGVSSTNAVYAATINLRRGKIVQVKFVEDGTLMLLWWDGTSTHLLSFPYSPNPDEEDIFCPDFYKIGDGAQEGSKILPALRDDQTTHLYLIDGTGADDDAPHAAFLRHTFPPQRNPELMELEVNGQKGRRVACILHGDGVHYSVLDIDTQLDGEDQEEEEQEEAPDTGDDDEAMSE
ncbi:hypothetical protein AJ80_06865 [Polytolypa hystricis UAMH7299]|uniref:Anaphase-promoting complex subunit 4 n=1 Tax=Polytolypa hystricis (strain UAMH7299) TaxID=1447883 RepID=A0A2B7XS45_POLH7|nr:hypothetical protein AJ80_06865 [Polytolypa hystricis UAMH7299]